MVRILGRGVLRALGFVLVTAATAGAESAADKATARGLATEGIRLFQEGKYTEALDRLERAQALYDAPIHLVYAARAQVGLGRFVEAAETYRRLARTELPPDASRPFRDAVEDGKRELAELEPRIPGLTITLGPETPPDLELRIDGEPVSAAILGVLRPVNPGEHIVTAGAPGYRPLRRTVQVKESESAAVDLALQRDEAQATLPSEPLPHPAPTPDDRPNSAEPSPPDGKEPSLAIVLGVRPGVLVPTGKLYGDSAAGDLAVRDRFGAGGGAEARAGLLFARYFTGYLFVEGYALNPGPRYEGTTNIDTEPTASLGAGGLGASVGTSPGFLWDKVRVFGELAVSVTEVFSANIDASAAGQTCTATQTYSGAALRWGGGAEYSLTKWFRLGPYLSASLGQVTSTNGQIDCDLSGGRLDPLAPLSGSASVPTDQRRLHATFAFGVLGEFLIRLK